MTTNGTDKTGGMNDLEWQVLDSHNGSATILHMTRRRHCEELDRAWSMDIPAERREFIAKALWPAPPRPDAAAFAQAVDRFESAALSLETPYDPDGSPDEPRHASRETLERRYNSARAALLAFAPSADAATITEEKR